MKVLEAVYNWFECPPRLLAIRRALGSPPARVLDVGCGNHSATMTKKHFPRCQYHGLDGMEWNVDDSDKALTDAFFNIDLENPEELSAIEDEQYDAVICSHVLEHLTNPQAVLREIVRKLDLGGVLYIEVPSARSTRLPRARDGWYGVCGCLNFEDDPTHRTLVNLVDVRKSLEQSGMQVGQVRPRRLWRRVLLLPLYASAGLILRGYVPASVVWDVSGFAETLIAKKPETGRGVQ